jgi:putative flavoprotein involved in K+ transport
MSLSIRNGEAARSVELAAHGFLPDEIDGHDLFAIATQRRRDIDRGRFDGAGVVGLGDIVPAPSVANRATAACSAPSPCSSD